MEIIINHTPSTLQTYSAFFIGFAAIWAFTGISLIVKWLFTDNPEKKLIIFTGILLTVLLFVAAIEYIQYEFDFATENIDNATDKIVEIRGSNRGRTLISASEEKYRFFSSDTDLYKDTLDYFLSNECEIEYYKFSKYIIRIKVIE